MTDYSAPHFFGKGDAFHTVVIVPGTTRKKGDTVARTPISPREFSQRVESVRYYLTRLLGGTTTVRGAGEWMFKHSIVKERVASVENFTKEAHFRKHAKELLSFLKKKKREWKQNTVAVQLEERMYYV